MSHPAHPPLPGPSRRLRDHTTDARMVWLALAAVVAGAGGAGGAWVLLRAIALATRLFWRGQVSTAPLTMADPGTPAALVLALPVLGGLIVGLMARFGSDKIRGHGIPEAIECILYGESRLSLKVALLKPLSAAVSIGSGGPFGAEGPIIMTGGAIGSLFAQCLHLTAAERKTLLVAGAAAGMTAIFGTPAAAILLALEVLLFEWKPRSLVPVAVAALVAMALRPALIGAGPLFATTLGLPGGVWPAGDGAGGGAGMLAAAAALGAVSGLAAAGLSATLYRIEDAFHRLPVHWMWWPALGAVAVGCGGMVDPRVLGAGYANIQSLLDGVLPTGSVVALLAVKAAVWLVALGSGTSGGVLAPLLIIGGALGEGMALTLAPAAVVPGGAVGVWALLGMAGMLGGALRAPLTGALFVVELTGRYEALPLALACAGGAYAVSVLTMPRSILTEKIARRGRHVLQEYGVDPHDLFQAGQIMTPAPAGGGNTGAHPAANVAAPNPMTQDWAEPATPIGVVADILLRTGCDAVPVLDPHDRAVVGTVSRHDLLKVRHAQRLGETARAGGLRPRRRA